jgi:hypothetical protein
MADQKLAVKTMDGYLEVNNGLVTDRASDPQTFVMRATGAIDYGATVEIWVGGFRVEVDRATSELHAVPPSHPGRWPSVGEFVIERLKGSTPHFGNSSEFALLSKYGCVRCSQGNVKVGGAVDTDAPAKLYALM